MRSSAGRQSSQAPRGARKKPDRRGCCRRRGRARKSRAGASSSSSSAPVRVFGIPSRVSSWPGAKPRDPSTFPSFVGRAAGLLAERFARQRAAEPLLTEIGDFEAHVPDDGHVATRGRPGRRVPRRGEIDEEEEARWQFAGARGQRARSASRPLRRAGRRARRLAVHGSPSPRTDPEVDRRVVPARVRLPGGLGGAGGRSLVERGRERIPTIAPATADDVNELIDFEEILYSHQGDCAELLRLHDAAARRGPGRSSTTCGSDDSYIPFVASDGRAASSGCSRSTGGRKVTFACRERNIDLRVRRDAKRRSRQRRRPRADRGSRSTGRTRTASAP